MYVSSLTTSSTADDLLFRGQGSSPFQNAPLFGCLYGGQEKKVVGTHSGQVGFYGSYICYQRAGGNGDSTAQVPRGQKEAWQE